MAELAAEASATQDAGAGAAAAPTSSSQQGAETGERLGGVLVVAGLWVRLLGGHG
jgi:hypothetical protein